MYNHNTYWTFSYFSLTCVSEFDQTPHICSFLYLLFHVRSLVCMLTFILSCTFMFVYCIYWNAFEYTQKKNKNIKVKCVQSTSVLEDLSRIAICEYSSASTICKNYCEMHLHMYVMIGVLCCSKKETKCCIHLYLVLMQFIYCVIHWLLFADRCALYTPIKWNDRSVPHYLISYTFC